MATRPSVRPISSDELRVVGSFLHENLDMRLSPERWESALRPTWTPPEGGHGFALWDGDRVVGVYAAFYSVREIRGRQERFCNLAAWCVLEEHRAEGLRLVRAMVGQRDWTLTDLSPSGNVVALDERLGFVHLETAGALVVNVPVLTPRGLQVVTDPARLEQVLQGEDLAVYRDHRDAAAARHLVLVDGDRTCYVVWRRVRRRRLPLFAAVLHVSDRDVWRRGCRAVGSHLLLRHGVPFTLVERRTVGEPPRGSLRIAGRPKMVRSATVRPDEVDDLYSELTCVPW